MRIFCPACGAPIPAEDLNLETLLARCRKCNEVFSFAGAVQAEAAAGTRRVPASQAAPALPRPPRIIVEELGLTWSAHWRWFTPGILFLVFFSIAWDSFLIFWYSAAIHSHTWLMIVFPIGHVAVGVGVTYSTLAHLLNTTRLNITRSEVSVHSGPVPWIGNRTLQSANIKQVFTRTVNSSNRNGSYTFGVFATLGDGKSLRLIGGLNNSDEAEYLQQQLEKRLDLRPTA